MCWQDKIRSQLAADLRLGSVVNALTGGVWTLLLPRLRDHDPYKWVERVRNLLSYVMKVV